MSKQAIIIFLDSFALFFLALCLCCVVVVLSIKAYRHMLQYHKPIRIVNVFSPEAITPLLQDNQTAGLSSTRIERVHVIILVHGFVGCPQDLAYLHHACEEQAAIVQRELQKELEPFYVYTCVSNHGRTNDGIVAGADRVAQEVRGFLESVQDLHHTESLQEITISMVGYSLGGLYARYALPEILQPLDSSNNKNDTNDDGAMIPPTPTLTPKVFCTIATPHLGSHGHTYVHVPKAIEKLFAWFSPTGRDLFHRSHVIHQTVSDPKWVEPLLKFERRVAYANTYASDIMVPTSTAAFVTPHSALEHLLVDKDDLDEEQSPRRRNNNNTNNPFAALVVETRAQHDMLREQLAIENEILQQRRQQQQQQQQLQSSDSSTAIPSSWDHARRLDAMGWSKVFVDFTNSYRPEIIVDTTTTKPNEYDFESNTTSFQRRRSSFQSSELHAEFQKSKHKLRAFLPNGHDQIAVNSKNVFYSYALRRGRPLIDELANEFVRDILLGPSPLLLSSSTVLLLSSRSVSNASRPTTTTTNEDATERMDHFSIDSEDVTAASR